MASSSSSSSTKVTLKLLVDTKNEKVLFAEAPKAAIDFVFNILRLPVGILTKDGSLGNLYQSVEKLDMDYMQPNIDKDVLLKPSSTASTISSSGTLGLLPATNHVDDSIDDPETQFYMCPFNCYGAYLTCDSNTQCRSCWRYMTRKMNFIGSKVAVENNSIKSGFVKEIVTLMVMDDLVIKPMSPMSSITSLNESNIIEVGTLQEKVVEVGMDEGVKLLEASMQSEMVLTSVFIKKEY